MHRPPMIKVMWNVFLKCFKRRHLVTKKIKIYARVPKFKKLTPSQSIVANGEVSFILGCMKKVQERNVYPKKQPIPCASLSVAVIKLDGQVLWKSLSKVRSFYKEISLFLCTSTGIVRPVSSFIRKIKSDLQNVRTTRPNVVCNTMGSIFIFEGTFLF